MHECNPVHVVLSSYSFQLGSIRDDFTRYSSYLAYLFCHFIRNRYLLSNPARYGSCRVFFTSDVNLSFIDLLYLPCRASQNEFLSSPSLATNSSSNIPTTSPFGVITGYCFVSGIIERFEK